MSTLADMLRTTTDLEPAESEWLHLLVGDWQLVSDLSFADLVLWGALLPAEAVGPARAAGRAFLDPSVAETLEASFARFSELTGRAHRGVSAYRLEDAGLILVGLVWTGLGALALIVLLVRDWIRKELW